ncbi:MAG: hypothetical protein J07HQW2_01836 [Haloquadratum walsbyi J07HQW2]|uniref:Uncharacterized protein n=1 Tax=Haloquadratum walsbyi J07HQW2 TaxID=1238425 RepID=U1PSQ5_9EURY|nr:MAG: hypothetical protein J07HQW2_01836 [Haloquadratum walsbyi J07HQW2]
MLYVGAVIGKNSLTAGRCSNPKYATYLDYEY